MDKKYVPTYINIYKVMSSNNPTNSKERLWKLQPNRLFNLGW